MNIDLSDFVTISKTGRAKLKVAPVEVVAFSTLSVAVAVAVASLFLAHILPPWASIIFLDIYRPSPVPELEPETNFVKSFLATSADIHCPLSVMLTII